MIKPQQLDEVLLYRGDASLIKTFHLNKASAGSLFGRGMYLTMDRNVARDYTVKPLIIDNYRVPDGETKQEAIRNAVKAAAGIGSLQWNDAVSDLMFQPDSNEKYAQLWKQWTAKGISRLNSMGKLSVQRMTTGSYRVVQTAQSPSFMSAYNLEEEYLSKFLDVDKPLPEDALGVIVKAMEKFTAKRPNIFQIDSIPPGNGTYPIGQWVNLIKEHPTRYAWQSFRFGGKGQYPAYDDIINGTHVGIDFKDASDGAHIDQLHRKIYGLGYKGLTFKGGIDIGGTINRGGGGRPHRVYVAWEPRVIEKSRVTQRKVGRPEVDDTEMDVPMQLPGQITY